MVFSMIESMSTTWPGTPVWSSSMPSDSSVPAGGRAQEGAEGGGGEPASRHREQDAQRGEQAETRGETADRHLGTQGEVGSDTREGPQIGGAHPGDVQRTQRDPGDERQVCDEEDTSCHTDAGDGAAAV